jgi:hypothetical protein
LASAPARRPPWHWPNSPSCSNCHHLYWSKRHQQPRPVAAPRTQKQRPPTRQEPSPERLRGCRRGSHGWELGGAKSLSNLLFSDARNFTKKCLMSGIGNGVSY